VSLRIAFSQIRPWGYKRPQMGLTGSIINVLVQLDVVQKALQQFINNTITIVVALKRRLQYKNAYQTGKVCVHDVMKALKELCSRALYKAENICINGSWNSVLAEEHGNSADTFENPSDFDASDKSENETPAETLVHGFTDSQCIRDLQDKIVEIAPAKGQRPLRIFKDKFIEEMNFPTLFYGDPHGTDITEQFSYHKIVRWELLHSNDYFSFHITIFFFKTMRIIIEQVLSCMWVQIRKYQLQGRKLLAKDVKYKVNLEKILKSDIGYIDFKNICTSLDYLQQKKKNIFAMIRQLGPPTFLVTFTSVEHC
jgi:hypothetical protein